MVTAFAALAVALVPLAPQAPPRARAYAVRDVRLSASEDAPRSTLIFRDGRIERVVEVSEEPPPDARVLEGKGLLALPAFVDAYSQAGCATPTPTPDRDDAPDAKADALIDMRDANRKGIQPSFRASEGFQLDAEAQKRWRSFGFGALLSAPAGQYLSGQSALTSTRQAPPRDAMISASAFQHAGFQATGAGYPGTLMGAAAQLRQFFLDARRSSEIASRRAAGKPGFRPPHDADLEAIRPALVRNARVVYEADSVGDVERAIRLSDEFGLEVGISRGRDAWKRAELLKQRAIPVFLTLDWGEEVPDPHADAKKKPKGAQAEETRGDEKPASAPESQEPAADRETTDASKAPGEPKDETIYEEPLRVREEKRRLWEETRACALRLAESGVPFAFGTGSSSPKELLERVRALVEAGLPRDVALRALTSGAAEVLGVGRDLGQVAPGFTASVALWTKDPLVSKEAKVAWLFVEGFPYEFEQASKGLDGKPDAGVDATGTWTLEFDSADARPATAELEMQSSGEVAGKIRYRTAGDETERSGDFEGHVSGKKLRLTGTVTVGSFEAKVVIEGEIEKDEMKGTTTWSFSGRDDVRRFSATRKPHDSKPHDAKRHDGEPHDERSAR